jgi:hypothetical protein
MASGKNAQIKYEASVEERDYYAMTDSGDHIIFPFDEAILSVQDEYTTSVRPNGIVSGTGIISAATGDDKAQTAAFTAYFAGALASVDADTDISMTRGAGSSTAYMINSIVCTAGGVVTALAGTGAESAFSAVRGAAGGPPSIPPASIEIGQIRMTSETSAAITADEIFQSVEGGQSERSDYPAWKSLKTMGDGNTATDDDKTNAYMEFIAALPVIHGATATAAATATKPVYAKTYAPQMTGIEVGTDWAPAQLSGSVSSTQYYGVVKASESESLGTAGFTAILEDGITDALVKSIGKKLTFQFFQDMNKAPYSLTQGRAYTTVSNPSDSECSAAVVVTAEVATVNFDE